jgi:hypothetical protein
MRIGADRRDGLKNSRDCGDRILALRNGDNSVAGAARIPFRISLVGGWTALRTRHRDNVLLGTPRSSPRIACAGLCAWYPSPPLHPQEYSRLWVATC